MTRDACIPRTHYLNDCIPRMPECSTSQFWCFVCVCVCGFCFLFFVFVLWMSYVVGCFEPSQSQQIYQGWKQTSIYLILILPSSKTKPQNYFSLQLSFSHFHVKISSIHSRILQNTQLCENISHKNWYITTHNFQASEARYVNLSFETRLKIEQKWSQKTAGGPWWRIHFHRNMRGKISAKERSLQCGGGGEWEGGTLSSGRGASLLSYQGGLSLGILLYYFFFFYNCIVPLAFFSWEIWFAFPGERELRQSRATQPPVHAGYFSVFTIHRTLTWTKGSLTCAQM